MTEETLRIVDQRIGDVKGEGFMVLLRVRARILNELVGPCWWFDEEWFDAYNRRVLPEIAPPAC